MTKTKSKNLLFLLVVALLMLSTTSFAAVYDWIGAVDFDWITPGNWDVTGSIWTWPNQEYGDSRVNQDCDEINISNGDTVNRNGELVINGAPDGSNESVLTIDNGSFLTVNGTIGVAEGNSSVGTLNIDNGIVDILGDLYVGKTGSSTGTLKIKNNTPDIERSLMVGKYLQAGFKDSSTGVVEIKNSTVEIRRAVNFGYWNSSTGTLELKNSDLEIRRNLTAGHRDNSMGTIEIISSTLYVEIDLTLGRRQDSSGTMEIKDNSIVNIGRYVEVGYTDNSTGTLKIKDSTLDIGEDMYIGHKGNSTGTLEIKGGTLDIGNDFILARRGASATLNIKGNSIINIGGEFQMNAEPTGMVSEVVMDDGVVTVGSDNHLNLAGAAGSMADFTLNDGTWINGGNIYVGETPEGDCYLTINGGTMVSDSMIFVGNPGGDDIGESIIFLNGGVLQGEGLGFNPETGDSLIIYKGGELRIRSSALDETDMQDLIDIGKIDVSAAPAYEITTVGDYTVLRPL